VRWLAVGEAVAIADDGLVDGLRRLQLLCSELDAAAVPPPK